MSVTFNLDEPEVANGNMSISATFWERYYNGLHEMRVLCSEENLYHGFRRTDLNPDPPLFNVIFELNHEEGLIEITIKCERRSVYFVGFRRGRGEPNNDPNPENLENREVWRQCNDFNVMTGVFNDAGFDARYLNDFGVGELGLIGLREAVIGLWYGVNEGKCFRTLAVHVAEPVSYKTIADHYKLVMGNELYGGVEFTDLMKEFIRNWSVVSNAIQEHFETGQPFLIPRAMLAHVTIKDAMKIMGIVKNRGIIED